MPQPRMTDTSWKIRMLLLRLRVHRLGGPASVNPNSLEYLYLVQQSKRISLAATVGRFSRWNILIWPVLAVVVLIKWLDLSLTTTLVRAFINESVLLKLSAEGRRNDAEPIESEPAASHGSR